MTTNIFELSNSGLSDRSPVAIEISALDDSSIAPPSPPIRGSLLIPLCLPTFAFGLIAVWSSEHLLHEVNPPLLTFAGCMIGLLTTFAMFRSQEAAAFGVLQRSDMRGADLAPAGVYRSLLRKMIHTIECNELKVQRITDHRARLEAKTHLQKNHIGRLNQTLDHVEQPVFLLDATNTLVYRNKAGSVLLTSAAGGTDTHEEAAWDSLDSLKSLVDSVRSRSAAADKRNAEFTLKCGGQSIVYRASATNLYEEDGRPSGVCVVLTDIREAVQEKGKQAEFVSSVSHELKTPLASIRAYTELMMDGDVDDPQDRLELLIFIDEQVERLTRLVDNLLNFSRVESGVIKVQREDVDVNRILRKSMDVVSMAAKEKCITIIDELSDLYLPAHLDFDLFGQAVINLLSNAIKYTKIEGEVRVRSRMQDTEAVIEVQDNGMGIPADALPRLFERFYRVPQNVSAASGTGLGLALVKYIVTNIHDGSISAASRVGQGSTFTIRIPLGHCGRSTRNGSTQRAVS